MICTIEGLNQLVPMPPGSPQWRDGPYNVIEHNANLTRGDDRILLPSLINCDRLFYCDNINQYITNVTSFYMRLLLGSINWCHCRPLHLTSDRLVSIDIEKIENSSPLLHLLWVHVCWHFLSGNYYCIALLGLCWHFDEIIFVFPEIGGTGDLLECMLDYL